MTGMTSLGGQSVLVANKISKTKGKMVKPILKKLSHSEKNSLDLDRGWDEHHDGGWDGGLGYAGQARDISFGALGGGDGTRGTGAGSGHRVNLKFQQHGRSASQTSAGSGPRAGFVHPFAQTPRTTTPPLSYANSLASLDIVRDCSPTITEHEDDDGFDGFDTSTAYPASYSHPHVLGHSQPPPACSSQSNLRRPSLISHRTASFPETPNSRPPSLRINTNRSISGTTATSSRLAHGSFSNPSNSDLHVDLQNNLSVSLTGTLDSPTGSLGASSIIASQQQEKQSQLSPLRTSLEMAAAGFPRLRARSELDTATRVENIRAARRKFEERERIKEEKHDREMIRKREARDNKEAARIEKGEAPSRPSMHRKRTPTALSTVSEPGAKPTKGKRSVHSSSVLGFSAPAGSGGVGIGIGRRRHTDEPTMTGADEKQTAFAARRYESVSLQTPPAFGVTVDDVHFEPAPRRGSGAKHKTQSYWQGFLLWFRTKLLRLSTR